MNYKSCDICPRKCGTDRTADSGFCHQKSGLRAARAALHMWEEPCISGIHGSGTVFFSGCTLRCCFCQNHQISTEGYGKELSVQELSGIFLRLQSAGAHNINLVTATQFLPSILEALELAYPELRIPIVYNCGGYERQETIRILKETVDIWLPDLKYFDSGLSARYSKAPDYFETAARAIKQMVLQTGTPLMEEFAEAGAPSVQLMKKGVIIRHMVLPGQKEDSIKLLHWMKDQLPPGDFYISLMSQYTPYIPNEEYPELNRRITTYEYQKVVDTALELGLNLGFMQKRSSAKEEYTPSFDLEGLNLEKSNCSEDTFK